MSDDLDFDMEVVEKDKLDEPRGNTEAGSYEAASSKSSSVERKSTDSGISKSSGGESAEEARVAGNGGGSTASPSLADSPDAWRQIKLGDLLSYEVSGTWGDDPHDGDGKPVLRATNFAPNSIDLGDVALRKISDSHRESKRLKEGDIVLERSGGSADQPVGRVLFFDLEGEYYPGNFLRLMRPDPEVVNRRYLYYYLDYRYKRGDTIPVQTNSTNIRNLQYTSYLNLDTQLPPLPEQRKIASVLYAVDQAIQKTETIIEQAKRVKTGLLQDRIFNVSGPGSVDRRFGPMKFRVPQEWDRVRLEEVTTLVTRGKQPTYAESGIPVINQKCIYWDGWYFENARYLDGQVAEEWKDKYFPEDGDVVINSTGRGTLGRAQVYRSSKPRAVDSHVTIVRPDQKKLVPGYLRYFLESHRGQGLLYSMCVTGSTGQIELSKSKLKLLSIPLPPVEEQHRIVGMIEQFDQIIRQNQGYEKQLQDLKKGLMQDLLTGEIRTTDKAIEVLGEVKAHG